MDTKTIIGLALLLGCMGCKKSPLNFVTATTSGDTVIGAGQSNMALMDLSVFRAKAHGVEYVYNRGVYGTELWQWMKPFQGQRAIVDASLPLLYEGLRDQIRQSGPKMKCLLWFQGETEGGNYPPGQSGYDTWGQRFTQIVADLRHDTGVNFPVIVVQLAPYPDSPTITTWDSVRYQQAALHISGVIVVNIDDIPRHRELTDLPDVGVSPVHYSNAQYALIAERLALTYNGDL